MACEYCEDLEKLADIRRRLAPDIKPIYCPVCGEYLDVAENLRRFKKLIDEMAQTELNRAIVEAYKAGDTVEVDGEELAVEYISSGVKPVDMGINLDTVDIKRELELLRKHLDHPLTGV